MDLSGSRLVLIGGGGLIGSHTIDQLLAEPVSEIVVYGGRRRSPNLKAALVDPRVRLVEAGDVLDQKTLSDAVVGADGVFHFASAWLLQCHEDPRRAFDINVRGTFNVMDACAKGGVKRLVYSSSSAVYGDARGDIISEDHPRGADSFYGATKIAGEAMLRAYWHRYSLPYVSLRYMNVYGPRQAYRGPHVAVIMKMLDAIDRGQGPAIFGDGSEAFDFIAAEDCARANLFAMKADTTDLNYNIATGIGTTLKELAELLINLTGSPAPLRYLPRASETLARSRIGDTRRAAEDLGFTAQIPLEVGLQRLIAWRREDMARSSGDEAQPC